MESITFKRRIYKFEERVPTNLVRDYVPDWDLQKAFRESIQNMIDEQTITGCKVRWYQDGAGAYFYDRGRGVDFADILYLGASGKRGDSRCIGQHGEGEIISFLVAAREGVTKYMASQDWLARVGFENVEGKDVLFIYMYKTQSPRRGTAWYYDSGWYSFELALDQFQAGNPGRARYRPGILLHDQQGRIYTRGLFVTELDSLLFAYNVEQTPGRDRAAFTFAMVKDEVGSLLENNEAALTKLLEYAMLYPYVRYKEFELELNVPEDVGKRAFRRAKRRAGRDKVCWMAPGQHRRASDARQQGWWVVAFPDLPPWWIRDAVPSVSEVILGKRVKIRSLPGTLKNSYEILAEILGIKWEAGIVHKFEDENQAAQVQDGRIVFARTHIKKAWFGEFVETVVHESAHLEGYEDCSRGHESAMARMLTKFAGKLATNEEVREKYLRAKKEFERYTG